MPDVSMWQILQDGVANLFKSIIDSIMSLVGPLLDALGAIFGVHPFNLGFPGVPTIPSIPSWEELKAMAIPRMPKKNTNSPDVDLPKMIGEVLLEFIAAMITPLFDFVVTLLEILSAFVAVAKPPHLCSDSETGIFVHLGDVNADGTPA